MSTISRSFMPISSTALAAPSRTAGGCDVGEQARRAGRSTFPPVKPPVVVVRGHARPPLVLLALDVRFARLTLGVERVEFLVESERTHTVRPGCSGGTESYASSTSMWPSRCTVRRTPTKHGNRSGGNFCKAARSASSNGSAVVNPGRFGSHNRPESSPSRTRTWNKLLNNLFGRSVANWS